MNQQSTRKRNFTSPTKIQTSIVTFAASSQGKKQNINSTPIRKEVSPLDRSFAAITSNSTPQYKRMNSNNRHAILRDDDYDEELISEDKGDKADNDSHTAETDPESTSSASQNHPKLLTRKLQAVIRRLKRLEKELQDQSIINEIEDVLGEGAYTTVRRLGTIMPLKIYLSLPKISRL